MFAETPAFPLNRRDRVPRSHPRREAVSVTFQPTSSMLSRISSPKYGGLNIGPAGSPSASSMIIVPPSIVTCPVDIHCLAVLEAKFYAQPNLTRVGQWPAIRA